MEALEETLQTILKASPKAIAPSQFSHYHKLKSIAIAARRLDLLGKNLEEKATIHQWIEFTLNHLAASTPDARAFIDVLNSCLSSRAFVAGGDRLSLADLVLFAATRAHFASISFQEKEKHLNVSRWFAHVQELVREEYLTKSGIENGKQLTDVVFLRSRLYQLAL